MKFKAGRNPNIRNQEEKMSYRKHVIAIVFALFGGGMSVACASMQPIPSKPVVGITSPPQGMQVNVGQELLVQANASDTAGVQHMELWVDGALVTTAQAPVPTQTFAGILRWTPNAPGTHTLVVKAINTAGVASDPSAVTITVLGTDTSTEKPNAPPPAPSEAAPNPSACVDDSEFVGDVTVPEGMDRNAGQVFNKIWRVRNTGTCDWSGYELVFVDGELMSAPPVVPVPDTPSGSTNDLLIDMMAPASAGPYTGQWQLRSPKSGLFGQPLQVTINVVVAAQPQPQPQQQSQPQPPAQPQTQPNSGCPGAPQIGNFIANPGTITAGQSSVLSWGPVTNATSATIDQGIGGVGTPGSKSVSPGQTTTYILTATGCGGTVTKQAKVTVNATGGGQPAPGVTLQPITGSILTPAGDAAVEDINLSTGDEIYLTISVSPPGSLKGSYTYKVYANGSLVKQANFNLPTGSQAFWTGYKVSGTQTIKATIDISDKDTGNNDKTKTCHSGTHICQ